MRQPWETKTIGEVCQIRGGGTPSKAVDGYWRGDVPWVSSKDMKSEIVSDSIDHITFEAIEQSAASLIPKGSVLMVVRSGILARTVPIAIAARDLTINQDLKALCPVRRVDARFLLYVLQSKMRALLSMVGRGATVHRLMTEQIRSLRIPVPPLSEQRRIVGILDEAFEGIDTAKTDAETNLQNARTIFESHLDSVFSERGAGWANRRFGEFATFRNGVNFTKSSRGESVKIVGVGNFQTAFWAPLDQLDRVTIDGTLPDDDWLSDGDLLFVRSNGNVELIGRCLLVGGVREKIAHSGFTIRARLVDSNVSSRYLCHFLKSSAARGEMVAGGTGTNIKSLSQSILASLTIPIPPGEEQTRIVDQMETLEAETQRLESVYRRKIAALDELKQSLLHQAFSGQL